MQPPFPAPVSEWHNDTYDAINPSKPSLSMAGKTIIITGGGTSIGRETVRTFAAAGAASIHILGRTQATLAETKNLVEGEFPAVAITVHIADVTDEKAVSKAANEIGAWDVLVSNAGYLAARSPISEADLTEWWTGFEINVKGSVITAQAFLPTRKPNASLVAISSAIVNLLPPTIPGSSSYASSKLAQVKFFEFVAAECPDLQVLTVHPGIVDTAMNVKSGFEGMPMDDVRLPGHFILWAASGEAAFAAGRFLWCNWDVEQLKTMEGKFKDDPFYLTSNVLGWPFP